MAGMRKKMTPPEPVGERGYTPLVLPRSYNTESTVIMIANDLGSEGWERIFSRLRVFTWDPLPEEQIEDLAPGIHPCLGRFLRDRGMPPQRRSA